MLTRNQLAKIAQKNQIGLGAQERDYIEHIFLSLLYGKSQDFVFKGGTALRIAYNFARFSEDLDFNSHLSAEEVKDILESTVSQLESFGVKAEFRNIKMFKENGERGATGDISYQGPLFIGKSESKGKVRVDVSLRGEEGETKRIVVVPKYDDISQFVLTVFSLNEIFAEKVRALIIRGKSRDLYDVWVLLGRGTEINYQLINKKLMLYQKTFDFEKFKRNVEKSKKGWERDLSGLLSQVTPFEIVKEEVLTAFKNKKTGK